jgi:hypothetical protein
MKSDKCCKCQNWCDTLDGLPITVDSASRKAFIVWRGKRPVSGYRNDLIAWDYETERLWKCWQAACDWKNAARNRLKNKLKLKEMKKKNEIQKM